MDRRSLSFFALLLLFTATLHAAEPTDVKELGEEAANLEDTASQLGTEKVYQALSTQLGIPVDTLKTQQADTKFGFGELFIANSLATASGKDFTTLAQQFQAGQGWGEIAKENGIKLGSVVSQMRRSNKAIERERNPHAGTGRAGAGERANRSNQSNRGHRNAIGHGRK